MGKELKRLGYTVSQLVQGYGILGQAITEETAAANKEISAEESKTLDLTLDLAIAEAVTGFARRVENADCAKKIGFLSHELRNALAAASVAHSMLKKAGGGIDLNAILERNLNRMRDILDSSFSEVRMQNEKEVEQCSVNLLDIAEEVEATAGEEARDRLAGQDEKKPAHPVVVAGAGLTTDPDSARSAAPPRFPCPSRPWFSGPPRP